MQAQYLPHEGELSALTKQNHNLREVELHLRSAIQDCGCDCFNLFVFLEFYHFFGALNRNRDIKLGKLYMYFVTLTNNDNVNRDLSVTLIIFQINLDCTYDTDDAVLGLLW